MQSNFNPRHLKKANEILSEELRTVKSQISINEVYRKEIFDKTSLWKRFLTFFNKYF